MTTTTIEQQVKSILVADDEKYARDWLLDELRKIFPETTQCFEASTATEALNLATTQNPDLILLDISFQDSPGTNGIKIAAQIWKQSPEARIIIVSSHKEEVYVREMYKVTPASAVYGYVLKNKMASELQEAVNCVLSGDCWIDRDVQRITRRLVNKSADLTDGELEALECAALGYTDETIGKLLCVTDRAIQARLQSIYSKWGLPKRHDSGAPISPRVRALWLALERGLLTVDSMILKSQDLSRLAKLHGIQLS